MLPWRSDDLFFTMLQECPWARLSHLLQIGAPTPPGLLSQGRILHPPSTPYWKFLLLTQSSLGAGWKPTCPKTPLSRDLCTDLICLFLHIHAFQLCLFPPGLRACTKETEPRASQAGQPHSSSPTQAHHSLVLVAYTNPSLTWKGPDKEAWVPGLEQLAHWVNPAPALPHQPSLTSLPFVHM